jgi:hypothetical protein
VWHFPEGRVARHRTAEGRHQARRQLPLTMIELAGGLGGRRNHARPGRQGR